MLFKPETAKQTEAALVSLTQGLVWIDGVWGCRLNWALPTTFEELGAGDQSVVGAEVPHKDLGRDDMK